MNNKWKLILSTIVGIGIIYFIIIVCFNEIEDIKVGEEIILDIPTYEESNQVVHPDILFHENKYYLAITPYPNSYDKHENPSFYESDNGINFSAPNGLINPIVKAPAYDHNCDTDMIFDKKTNMFYIYYLETLRPYYNNVVLLRSSDKVNWDRTNIINYDLKKDKEFILSPTIVQDDNKYYMYYVDNTTHSIKYLISNDGIKWNKNKSNKININFPKDFNPWHVDIIRHKGKFYMLNNGYTKTFWNEHHLYLAVSDNLKDWNFIKEPIIKSSKEFYNSDAIYRSSGLIKDNDLFVWFSYHNKKGKWNAGIKRLSLDSILNSK